MLVEAVIKIGATVERHFCKTSLQKGRSLALGGKAGILPRRRPGRETKLLRRSARSPCTPERVAGHARKTVMPAAVPRLAPKARHRARDSGFAAGGRRVSKRAAERGRMDSAIRTAARDSKAVVKPTAAFTRKEEARQRHRSLESVVHDRPRRKSSRRFLRIFFSSSSRSTASRSPTASRKEESNNSREGCDPARKATSMFSTRWRTQSWLDKRAE